MHATVWQQAIAEMLTAGPNCLSEIISGGGFIPDDANTRYSDLIRGSAMSAVPQENM